ncbi:MAG: isoleucine--tRNA ligase [Holophagales bacterium]|jgi:isoleucyl-tRNA synthetase|nr:isoleucine--tRNA ligase [Holophagales bacterium]
MSDTKVKKYPVLLPKTEFPMKADLPQREPKRLEKWNSEKLYERIEATRRADNSAGRGKGRRILHDGPPYANGAIHMGHAMNKILKDIVVKSLWLDGYESPYVPGWDCHGLPVEHAVEKNLGTKRREITRAEFLAKCRSYAQKWVDVQRTGFQRLGVLGAWQEPYITMAPAYEAAVVRLFARLFERGIVTRKLKVVHWSYGARTALAEAEVEYADKTSYAITVAFPVPDDEAARFNLPAPLYLPIWTTTPWTLPSNLAIAMHPGMEYAVVQADNRCCVVAVSLLENLQDKLGVGLRTIEIRKGSAFQGLKYKHAWIDRFSPVLLADYVTDDTGTGLVHTAPDHGVEDFGLANHLGLLQLVGTDGRFTSVVNDAELEGKNIFDTNPIVVERLRSIGALLHDEKLQHSYPHCWRTKTPIFFRATEQWFITMDDQLQDGKSLREMGLEGVDATEWAPPQGRNRIQSMISSRPDWCISRQRAWGTPITVLRCTDCGEPLIDASVFKKAAEAIEKGGVETWSELPLESLLPPDSLCSKCGSKNFQKETDILDVWIDSGVSATIAAEIHSELRPDDYGHFIYLEGSDQHRGWFHSSLLFNLAVSGNKPYDTVVTHGFLLDGKGQKMSKSEGNAINPEDVIKTMGADILRLWVASSDYHNDISISNEILNRNSDAYRKLRNTLRFMLGALEGFDPSRDAVPQEKWTPLDCWIWNIFSNLAKEVIQAYKNFDFLIATQSMLSFCQLDLSNRYFEIIKDRLYCDSALSLRRQSCRTLCWKLAHGLCILLAPIISFTADEVWEYLPGVKDTVFEQRFPEFGDVPLLNNWKRFWEIREAVQAAMEPHRASKTIGTSLDANVELTLPKADIEILNDLNECLEDIFVVSGIKLIEGDLLQVKVEAHGGIRCPRCWNHSGGAGQGEDIALCPRCHDVVKAQG